MNIDLSRFRVVYGDKVLNAVSITDVVYKENEYPSTVSEKCICKPLFLTVIAINEDGNLIAICDVAWSFQFLPIVKKAKIRNEKAYTDRGYLYIKSYNPYVHGVCGTDIKLTFKQKIKILFCKGISVCIGDVIKNGGTDNAVT